MNASILSYTVYLLAWIRIPNIGKKHCFGSAFVLADPNIFLYYLHIFIYKWMINNRRRLSYKLKGIVSRDFRGLQMILMDWALVLDIPPEAYLFLFTLSYSFLSTKFSAGTAFINAISKSLVSCCRLFFFCGKYKNPSSSLIDRNLRTAGVLRPQDQESALSALIKA